MDSEHSGFRSAEYSSWHRRASIRRFVGEELASSLTTIDLDHAVWIEYADGTKEPLLLIETALDIGQEWKATTVLRELAKRASLPAYVVLYKRAARMNEGDARFADIDAFRVRRVWPDPDSNWAIFTPQEWAEDLLVLRARGAARLDAERRAASALPPWKKPCATSAQ